MSSSSTYPRRADGERGVTLILFALAMLAILFIVALVVDLSNVRSTRQSNKLTTDVATSAGVSALAPDGIAKPWRGVCAALTFLKANRPDISFANTTYWSGAQDVAGNPVNPVSAAACTSLAAQECSPNTPSTWAWIRVTDGGFVADLRSGYTTPDARFAEDADAYQLDDGAGAQGGCDQLAVLVANRDAALFGGAAGATGYETLARSVGRVKIGSGIDAVPAFLMLERKACDTLSEQVGSGEAGIIVDPASATEPGIIHVDSSGSPSTGCNGNNNPGGWAVYSSGSSGPKIQALPSGDGTKPGIIAIHALQVGAPPIAYGGANPAGLSPAPTAGGVVSRRPVDLKYNPDSSPTITNIHAAAYTDAGRGALSAPPSTYPSARPGLWTVLDCTTASLGSAAAKILVDCPGGFAAGALTIFSSATDVIFNGPVSVANNRQLYMPAAVRIVIGGNTSGGLNVAGGGRLGINSAVEFADSVAGVTGACVGREGPAWTQTTELTIFGGRATGNDQGALNVTGRAALCQTFVYLAGPRTASYAAQQLVDGSYDPSCQPSKPCAKSTGNTATNAFVYVGGLLQWSAPNQLSADPTPGSVGVEDLALWAESADLSQIKTGGDLRARGVFFLPNARVEMRSPSSATPQDAQFISRSLQLKQGTLRMQPTPNNAVRVPVLEGLALVR